MEKGYDESDSFEETDSEPSCDNYPNIQANIEDMIKQAAQSP